MILGEEHKRIYNLHLKVNRTAKDKPFKYRKNFDTLNDEVIFYLNKLFNFFNKYKHINIEEYFFAPYALWNNDGYYDLKFYTTRKSLVAYNTYKVRLVDQTPDTPYNLKCIVDSLKFIKQFCKEKQISVKDYVTYKENGMYAYLNHLNKRNITIYVMYGFSDFKENFKEIDNELKKYFLGNYYINLLDFESRFYNSSKARRLVKDGLTKIENSVN